MATDATSLMIMRAIVRCVASVCVAWCTLLGGDVLTAQETNPRTIDRVDLVMNQDPPVQSPVWTVGKQDAPHDLWMAALKRPDAELQRLLIDTFAIAHRRGMHGVRRVVPELVRLLGEQELDRQVELSAVRALVAFDERDQASLLSELSRKRGVEIATVVEPALASWKSDVLLSQWQDRLSDTSTDERMLTLAIEGVAALGDKNSTEVLLDLLNDRRISDTTHLLIARTLGQIESTGLEKHAETRIQIDPPDLISDLIAVRLLGTHSSDQTIELLGELAERKTTAVQAVAMERLLQIDFRLLLPLVSSQIDNRDVNVRRQLARAMYLARDQKWVPLLATLLNDVNPELRALVADQLVDLANDRDLRDGVIESSQEVLAKDAWRGCEQAIFVLIALEQEQISDRLVDLMRHDRGEVMMAAGWGLQRLGLPRHLPEMLDRANELNQGIRSGKLSATEKGPQDLLAQLFLSFGLQRYQKADPLMRTYIPKRLDLGFDPRPAAVWALGYLHEGKAPKDLSAALEKAMADDNSLEPEMESVRTMAAASLGRMKSKSALDSLRQMNSGSYSAISQVSSWAIEQITGSKGLEPKQGTPMHYNDWFLSPMDQWEHD